MNLTREHRCDICGCIPKKIIDGQVKTGQWAWMCESCWDKHGRYESFGTGKGQKYENKKGGEKLEG